MSPMAVAPAGCKAGVKELAKKATGEMRSRPSRRRGWLRDHMASANECATKRNDEMEGNSHSLYQGGDEL
jgi:hypothetical protein